jgi:hypothetical protein
VRGRSACQNGVFWLFWGAKKGRLFWCPPKKSPVSPYDVCKRGPTFLACTQKKSVSTKFSDNRKKIPKLTFVNRDKQCTMWLVRVESRREPEAFSPFHALHTRFLAARLPTSDRRSACIITLVPKLCLGTHFPEAPLRGPPTHFAPLIEASQSVAKLLFQKELRAERLSNSACHVPRLCVGVQIRLTFPFEVQGHAHTKPWSVAPVFYSPPLAPRPPPRS